MKIDFSTKKGALFSDCGQYRFILWRNWNALPKILVVGLNPSTADCSRDDATTRKVTSFAKKWGYGGLFLMNCFPYISTDPKGLVNYDSLGENDQWLRYIKKEVGLTIFAWGNFEAVTKLHRDSAMARMFPNAKVIDFNLNGSPKHPLYASLKSEPRPYRTMERPKLKTLQNSAP